MELDPPYRQAHINTYLLDIMAIEALYSLGCLRSCPARLAALPILQPLRPLLEALEHLVSVISGRDLSSALALLTADRAENHGTALLAGIVARRPALLLPLHARHLADLVQHEQQHGAASTPQALAYLSSTVMPWAENMAKFDERLQQRAKQLPMLLLYPVSDVVALQRRLGDPDELRFWETIESHDTVASELHKGVLREVLPSRCLLDRLLLLLAYTRLSASLHNVYHDAQHPFSQVEHLVLPNALAEAPVPSPLPSPATAAATSAPAPVVPPLQPAVPKNYTQRLVQLVSVVEESAINSLRRANNDLPLAFVLELRRLIPNPSVLLPLIVDYCHRRALLVGELDVLPSFQHLKSSDASEFDAARSRALIETRAALDSRSIERVLQCAASYLPPPPPPQQQQRDPSNAASNDPLQANLDLLRFIQLARAGDHIAALDLLRSNLVDELRDQPELLKQLSSLLLFSDSHESPEWHTMCTLEHRTLCHVTQPLLTRIEEHLPATQSVPELVEILRYLLWTADQYRPSDEFAALLGSQMLLSTSATASPDPMLLPLLPQSREQLPRAHHQHHHQQHEQRAQPQQPQQHAQRGEAEADDTNAGGDPEDDDEDDDEQVDDDDDDDDDAAGEGEEAAGEQDEEAQLQTLMEILHIARPNAVALLEQYTLEEAIAHWLDDQR